MMLQISLSQLSQHSRIQRGLMICSLRKNLHTFHITKHHRLTEPSLRIEVSHRYLVKKYQSEPSPQTNIQIFKTAIAIC